MKPDAWMHRRGERSRLLARRFRPSGRNGGRAADRGMLMPGRQGEAAYAFGQFPQMNPHSQRSVGIITGPKLLNSFNLPVVTLVETVREELAQ